mgnify:CR=1 FL=1
MSTVRRRVRQADPPRARREPGSLGSVVARRHRVVGRDVVEGDQAGAAATQPTFDHGRLAWFERGDRHGEQRSEAKDGSDSDGEDDWMDLAAFEERLGDAAVELKQLSRSLGVRLFSSMHTSSAWPSLCASLG